MTRIVPLTALAAALALAACSKEPAKPQPTDTASSPATTEEAATPLPQASETSPAPVASEAIVTEIPQAAQGRWGLVPADCTSKLGDAKGLLTVSARQLKFYESVAKLGAIKEADAQRIRATFSYSGEGQTWTQDVVLDVQDGGKTMIRRDYGPDAMPGPLKYTRCA